jgi:hypothetical protein
MNHVTALDPIPGIQTGRALEHERVDAQETSKKVLLLCVLLLDSGVLIV